MRQSERFLAGWNKLKEIDGEAGEKVINGTNILREVAKERENK